MAKKNTAAELPFQIAEPAVVSLTNPGSPFPVAGLAVVPPTIP